MVSNLREFAAKFEMNLKEESEKINAMSKRVEEIDKK